MASAYPDCSDRDFKSESAAEEGPLDSEDRTGEKSPSAVSSPLYYPDSEEDGCSGDSGGFVRMKDWIIAPRATFCWHHLQPPEKLGEGLHPTRMDKIPPAIR